MKGRGTGDNEAAQAFNGSFTQNFSFTDEKTNQPRLGTNVIGYLEGSETPNEYMVIGAHYDHMGVVEGKIFNGADDNASGTSAC